MRILLTGEDPYNENNNCAGNRAYLLDNQKFFYSVDLYHETHLAVDIWLEMV